ncbi:unnamed protein product [Oppiella nova]|uniref:Uncharacterized protein n=1 Tax=Oppiella nova TaxID=334625 RepID=A0A7R9QGX2_9ACAR|nr:unnamed protein product [Oppiella nova]CAG2165119.1 unnamed protein product [Oppiella nova]
MLYKELKELEQKIFNTILEGKLRALNRIMKDLQDDKTLEVQKVAAIGDAISQFDEILPVFAKENTIFRERFYHGAPLFVRFCTILKAICLIAEQTTDYNTSNLQSLKQNYQEVLDWYRIKCIGRRMASCYVKGMLVLPGVGDWVSDWDRHYEKYKKYYEESTWFQWIKYAENLGGEGWRLWCGWTTYCNLIDTWDTRAHDEVQFEPLELKITSETLKGEEGYHRDVLAEYRKRVEVVMSKFFDDIRKRPPNVDIKYGRETIYCFDNEAFRFAVASAPPNNMVFDDMLKRDYEINWQRSVKECDRLLERIISIPPHKVMDTLSLNNSKQNILLLTKPLADIAKNISDNVKQCERHKKRIHEFTGDIKALLEEISRYGKLAMLV